MINAYYISKKKILDRLLLQVLVSETVTSLFLPCVINLVIYLLFLELHFRVNRPFG